MKETSRNAAASWWGGIALLSLAATGFVQAYTFSWANSNWQDEQLSGSYSNVDSSGVVIDISITGDTGGFQNNYPQVTGDDRFKEKLDFTSNTTSVKTTFKFSYPVKLTDLKWQDIDYRANDSDDKIIVTAKTASGETVYPNNVRLGSDLVQDADGGIESNTAHDAGNTDASNTATVDFTDKYITEMSFVYTNGDQSPNPPKGQAIWFNDVTFTVIDTDNDGVNDALDIDDDNDGIVDALEKPSTGVADAYTQSGVDNPGNALGEPDGQVAVIKKNDTLTLDLTDTVPAGEDIDITLARDDSKGDFDIMASADGVNWTKIGTYNGGTVGQLETVTYQAPAGGARYIRFDRNGGGLQVDAVRYAPSSKNDTDGDGIPNYLDLDSDNDGIPDNVEAQSTGSYIAPASSFADADGDGLADKYDPDANGGVSLNPVDSDRDGTPDMFDSDSDNDGYTDCEEGWPDTTSGKSCPVSASDTNASNDGNGLISWGDTSSDNYSDPNGNVGNSDSAPKTDLFNETGNTDEVGYREFLCGKAEYKLTKFQWRLIAIPCDTGSLHVSDLFSQIGTYGAHDDYVLFEQTGGDNYEVNETAGSSHKNTEKRMLDANDTLQQGVSYWIITDKDVNVTIDKTLSGLAPTSTQDANASAFDIADPDFLEVHGHSLPNNLMKHSGWVKKYMAGNPFPYSFNMNNLYFSHGGGGNYHPMGNTANDPYISSIVYTHDSSDTTDKNVTAGGGYQPIDPATPGMGGSIVPMEGFFIKILENSDQGSNSFAYPLTYGNDK